MKPTLRFFGFLDLLSIVIIAPQAGLLLANFKQIPSDFLFVVSLLRTFVFFSLFISATGLLLIKKFGIISYYFQFIFRFVTLIFSFGFITYINDFFAGSEAIIRLTLSLAVLGEFLRLYYTYKIHRKYF